MRQHVPHAAGPGGGAWHGPEPAGEGPSRPASPCPPGRRPRALSGPLSCSMEMCDQRHNITMCPLCDKTCSYWKMSSACATARASHLFDNPATVFFSVFMALWGKRGAQPRRPAWGGGGWGRLPSPGSLGGPAGITPAPPAGPRVAEAGGFFRPSPRGAAPLGTGPLPWDRGRGPGRRPL